MQTLRRLWKYLVPQRVPLIIGLGAMLVSIPAQLFHPLVWRFIVDQVVIARKTHLLVPALLVMIAVALVGSVVGAIRSNLLEKVGERFVIALRADVYEKLQGQSLAYHHNHRVGDLISRAIGDVDALRDAAIRGIDSVLGSVLSFVVVAGILVRLNWVLGLSTLLPMAIVFGLVRRFNRHVRAIYRSVRDKLGDVSATLQENLSGITVIKAFAREEQESARFWGVLDSYLSTSFRAVNARSLFFPAVQFVGFLGSVIMIGLGAVLVLQGRFTVGGLVAYRAYWWQLYSPIDTLATVNELLQRALAAGNRVFELLDAEETVADASDAVPLEHVRGEIRLQNVSFAYEQKFVLRNVDLEIPAGHTVAFVGPSGAGKSTLLNLVPRFYDPISGQVLIDGYDVRQVTQRSLRRHIGIVLQETFLFAGTVKENIRFGRPDATDPEIEEAARRANAHEFITSLPNGYETIVGERGVKLSGGQRQRIAIARAFLADPKILILDEATSSVEPESESIIQSTLDTLMRGRTTLLTSHRLSVVRNADFIVTIADGGVAEVDTHDELLAKGGIYADMYRLQMGGLG